MRSCEGALDAVEELGVRVLLVGDEAAIRAELPAGTLPAGSKIRATTQVIDMHDEPGTAVRKKKDASVVRCAEAVRDGDAHAMVGAGNTGATMAAALLRFGRIKGAARPAIGVPIPVPFAQPHLLVDGGATVDCTPEWFVQFAHMGRAYARLRLGVDEPTVGLLSNGEEPGKGDELRKQTFALLDGLPWFVGNVEGRDLMSGKPDVIVTDGFTGNVALKTIEGALKAAAGLVFTTLSARPRRRTPPMSSPRCCSKASPNTSTPTRSEARHSSGVRGLRDFPRFVECPRDRQRRGARDRLRARRLRRSHAGASRGAAGAGVEPSSSERRPMPAETHSTHEPIGPDDVFATVRTHLAEILEIDDSTITLDANFAEDLNADSLALIELVEALEEDLGERTVGFTVDDEDLGDLRLVRDAVDYVVPAWGPRGLRADVEEMQPADRARFESLLGWSVPG